VNGNYIDFYWLGWNKFKWTSWIQKNSTIELGRINKAGLGSIEYDLLVTK